MAMKSTRRVKSRRKVENDDVSQEKSSDSDQLRACDKQFICEICKKTFFKRNSLILHLQAYNIGKDAEEGVKQIMKERPHACNICNKRFTAKKNLLKHLRIIHKNLNEAEKLQIRKTRCPKKDCLFACRKLRDLRSHVEKSHKIKILKDCLQFHNDAVFQKWKKEEESNSVSWFVAFRRKSLLRNGNKKQTLSCHRTGQYNPKGAGKHRLKSHGSCKIGGTCPAAMEVTELPDGQLTVIYYKTHLGHSQDVVHLQLSKEERAKLSERIEQGFSLDAILEDIKESIDPADGKTKRIHLLSRKDLYNIMQSFNSSKIKRRIPKNKSTEFSNSNENENETSASISKSAPAPPSLQTSIEPDTRRNAGQRVEGEFYTLYTDSRCVEKDRSGYAADLNSSVMQYHRHPTESQWTQSEGPATSQVVIVSPDINYRSVTEVILVHPTESITSHLSHTTAFSPELMAYQDGSKAKLQNNTALTDGQYKEMQKVASESSQADSKPQTGKSNITLQLQDKVEKILEILPKSEFLTPKQYELINKKLESVIDVLSSVISKTRSKKLAVKKGINSKTKPVESWQERSSEVKNVVTAEANVMQQPMYESPLYAYLCNYN